MGLFTSAKAKLAAQKLAEEKLYELAAKEVAADIIREGLMAKALAETGGSVAAANARYLKLRVETMKAEADLHNYAASSAVDTTQTSILSQSLELLKSAGYVVNRKNGKYQIIEPSRGLVRHQQRSRWLTEDDVIHRANKLKSESLGT